jgi:hypothetical protein
MEIEEVTIDGIKYLRIGGKLFPINKAEGVIIPYDDAPDISYEDLPDGQPVIVDGKDLEVIFNAAETNDTVIVRYYWQNRNTGCEISAQAFSHIFELSSQIRRTTVNIVEIKNDQIFDDDIFIAFTAEITGKKLPEVFRDVRAMMDDILKPIKEIEAMIKEKCDELQRIADGRQY